MGVPRFEVNKTVLEASMLDAVVEQERYDTAVRCAGLVLGGADLEFVAATYGLDPELQAAVADCVRIAQTGEVTPIDVEGILGAA
jgi:hypothetical protein